jgi:hypothetical protein
MTHSPKCKETDPRYEAAVCDCDGYHTFDELYEHRIELFIALCKAYEKIGDEWGSGGIEVWKSKKHSDGELAFGGTWFVLGIGTEKGEQITYHLPIAKWEEAPGDILDKAPEFDGHTSEDVLNRLKSL